ncbi:hypothetical protein [Nocardiopsis coralli]|nr:hypothetical protein [Nocardiopsis coralli]
MSDATKKYSVTLPEDLAEDARSRSGGAGLSAYVTRAVRREIERERLAELLEAMEAENGPSTPEGMDAALESYYRAAAEQSTSEVQRSSEGEAA